MENHEGIKRISKSEKEKANIKKRKKEGNLKRNNKISKRENCN